ncbi:tol-pal system-associated acyl-CoA thioesterase, partial [Vibrio sp.]|nr:tol-pal system-associated acyl-CoA thioesterase [Vibrio sp.]
MTFSFPVTVYYEDTDAGGVVYHSNYLNYCERARTELLRSLGVTQRTLLEENIGFVVRHADISYLTGAKLDDQLIVQTSINNLKKASMVFCQNIVNSDGKRLCQAKVKVACVSMHTNESSEQIMKPVAIPEDI